MIEGSTVLTQEMRELALQEGAVLFGVGSVDRFDGAPRGHHPAEMVRGARTVISIGVPLVEQVADWQELFLDSELLGPEIRKTMLQDYLYAQVNYDLVNDRLNQVALRLALVLQAKGYRSLMFPATYGPAYGKFSDMVGWKGLFSQRHAAVRAGLGEFGLNNVVVTPEYGPRVRFNSVITQAPLDVSPLLKEKACLGAECGFCVDQCPAEAIRLLPSAHDESAVWLNPVSRTNMAVCREKRPQLFCYGWCIRVCPVGKHTRGVASSA